MRELDRPDKAFLRRVNEAGEVHFTYAPCMRGGSHAKLVDSNMPAGHRLRLHLLAVEGFVSERVAGCGGKGEPPTTTWHYALTAMGRSALGLHKELPPAVNRGQPLSDAELEAEGIA